MMINIENGYLIETRQLRKNFYVGNTTIEVLKGIDFYIYPEEIVSIVGPSGAGKTTFLHLLGLLDRQTAGEIYIEGKNTKEYSDEECAEIRSRKIGFVFQQHNLLPEFTILENVMLPGLIAGRSFSDVKEKAYKLLKELLLEKIVNHRPTMISFGEAQRVAIARALINSPKLILADEPTGSLDWETQREVKKVLWDKVRENNCAMIFVTHDINLAKGANRVLRLINGRMEVLKEE